jgi:transposase
MDIGRYLVEAHLNEGRSVAELAAEHGVHRSWIYKLLARYREEGEAGLVPRSTRPHRSPTQISDLFEDEIISVRKELLDRGFDAGAITIHSHLSRRWSNTPSTSTIWRVLKARGFVTPQPHKRPRSSYVRFVADLPNELWQTDVTHVYLNDGRQVEILNFIDDHSRLCLASKVFLITTSRDVVLTFTKAAETWGFPASVLSDNGAIFTASYRNGVAAMESELLSLGIEFKHSRPYHPAVSTSERKELGELLRWFHESKSLARSVVEALGDAGKVPGAQGREVGPARHVLAQQPVRVLVRAPLPGTARVTKVDLDAGVDGEVGVPVHLFALIPGDRLEELFGETPDRPAHGCIHLDGETAVGKVQEHHIASGSLDECAHLGVAVLPDDEVTLPVSWDGAILDLLGTLADHHHPRDVPSSLDPPLGSTLGTTRAQAPSELATQLTSALDEQGLVDRLVAHPHHRIVGILEAQAPGDLLGRPPLLQPPGHLRRKLPRSELSGLRPKGTLVGPVMRPPRSIVVAAAIGRYLSRDRADGTAELVGDGGEGVPTPDRDADLLALSDGQTPRSRDPAERFHRARRCLHDDVPRRLQGRVDLLANLFEVQPLGVQTQRHSALLCRHMWLSHLGPPRFAGASSAHRDIARTP